MKGEYTRDICLGKNKGREFLVMKYEPIPIPTKHVKRPIMLTAPEISPAYTIIPL
jgi:hypothetical protein